MGVCIFVLLLLSRLCLDIRGCVCVCFSKIEKSCVSMLKHKRKRECVRVCAHVSLSVRTLHLCKYTVTIPV